MKQIQLGNSGIQVPAMQMICGSMNETRLSDIIKATEIRLTRQEWYDLYLKAGHILP